MSAEPSIFSRQESFCLFAICSGLHNRVPAERTWVIVRQTNMADFLEDVGVGYYRSLDPPKNFVVKYENILLPIIQFKIISI